MNTKSWSPDYYAAADFSTPALKWLAPEEKERALWCERQIRMATLAKATLLSLIKRDSRNPEEDEPAPL